MVPEKITIFIKAARKGLPKRSQGINERATKEKNGHRTACDRRKHLLLEEMAEM